jgi:hypothetical protein
MNSPQVVFTPKPNSTPEAGLSALVAVYRRAVERYEEANVKEKGSIAPDDAEESTNDRTDTASIQR